MTPCCWNSMPGYSLKSLGGTTPHDQGVRCIGRLILHSLYILVLLFCLFVQGCVVAAMTTRATFAQFCSHRGSSWTCTKRSASHTGCTKKKPMPTGQGLVLLVFFYKHVSPWFCPVSVFVPMVSEGRSSLCLSRKASRMAAMPTDVCLHDSNPLSLLGQWVCVLPLVTIGADSKEAVVLRRIVPTDGGIVSSAHVCST